jgi:hypothetical protein
MKTDGNQQLIPVRSMVYRSILPEKPMNEDLKHDLAPAEG